MAPKAQPFEKFVERARAVHGRKYEYVEESYTEIHGSVVITCPKHGQFQQSAHSHVNKRYGCPACGKSVRAGIEDLPDFLKKALAVHGDKYNYAKVIFKAPRQPVTILCPAHGEFHQTPYAHIVQRGSGCPTCANNKKKSTFTSFVSRATAVHQSKYIYPAQEYVNSYTKVKIGCPEHGQFLQTPTNHLSGRGCRKCHFASRLSTLDNFIAKANVIHHGKYTYPHQDYSGRSSKIVAVCPVHGEFTQGVKPHLSGQGCPECAYAARRSNFQEFVAKADAVHNKKYVYPQQDYENSSTKIKIKCPNHGYFLQAASGHLAGQGCRKCHVDSLSLTFPEFTSKARKIHGDRYVYPKQEYTGQNNRVEIVCQVHGAFRQLGNNHLQGSGCPRCTNFVSSGEDEVRDFLLGLGLTVHRGRNRALPGMGKFELDMVIHEKKLAIEYNGVYWHSVSGGKGKNYHLKKTELVESLGYQLIHIFEDEWLEKRSIVEARLTRILAPHKLSKVFARKCTVSEVPWKTAKDFLGTRHLQGCGTAPAVSLGVFYGGELKSVATFGPARFTKGCEWELLRFASSGIVVGGLGKVIAHFARVYATQGQRIVSYADRRWSQGGVYAAVGFYAKGASAPGYGYVKQARRLNRQKFQKHKLAGLFDNFDPELTEEENCRRNGYFRIYDCGVSRWVKTL